MAKRFGIERQARKRLRVVQASLLSLLAAPMLLPASVGLALTGDSFGLFSTDLSDSERSVAITGFRDSTKSLNLLQQQQVTQETAIQDAVRAMSGFANSILQIKVKASNGSGFGLVSASGKTADVDFSINGVPFCANYHLRSHTSHSGKTTMLGLMPELNSQTAATSRADWPYMQDVQDVATDFLVRETDADPSSLAIEVREQCYAIEGREIFPAWKITFLHENLPLHVVADSYKVFAFTKGYFDATKGTSKVYRNNPEDTEMVIVTLPGLVGDGTLKTSYLRTVVPSNFPKVQNEDHEFFFETTSPQYDEVAAFTYAQLHYDFMKKLGFEWYGPKPMDIMLHVRPNGQINNALFVPAASATSFPRIEVGDGDGKALKGLSRDADVIAHEFGHHVVYQTLKDTEQDALALHEGLADFFAFARTEDSCLGESICPSGSEACWVTNKCLRTADNSLNYKDPLFRKLGGHFQGQLVSGMLWDMRSANVLPPDDLNKLVFGAVGFLPRKATFKHFLVALLVADERIFESTYQDAIIDAATDRGMGDLLADVDLSEGVPLPETVKAESLTDGGKKPGGSSTKSTKSDGGMSCAVWSGPSNQSLSGLFLILAVLVFPTFIPVSVRVRASFSRSFRRSR